MTPLPLSDLFKLVVDLLRVFTDGPAVRVLEQLTDVALGGVLAVVGTIVADSWHRRALRGPRAR
jgi:hypothetical protein